MKIVKRTRHRWPKTDVVEVGLVQQPDYLGQHYVKWRNPRTGRVLEMWAKTKMGAFRRAICAWRRIAQECADMVAWTLK